jgi:putative hydrolase
MSDVPFGFQPADAGDDDDREGDLGGESAATPPGSPLDPFAALLGGSPQDLGAAFQRLGQLLSSSSEGPVNWEAASDTARQTVAQAGDAAVTMADRQSVEAALDLADLWLDPATALPSAGTRPSAWSRADWVHQTLPQWRELIEPLARRVAEASTQAVPPEMREMAGPLLGVMQQMSGAMFGAQVGQGLGTLAQEVVGSTDVALPLAPAGTSALVPDNVRAFGDGLGVPAEEVRLYLALFHHAPWLRTRITSAIDDYARGISIDVSSIESALGGIDPSNPAALQELVTSGVFEPPTTPEQSAALARLEAVLALIEGWVDDVVDTAAEPHLPAAPALREAVRRARATGGPAQATFASLVGLELTPRRVREAAALWHALAAERGIDGRDSVWDHPDLMPGADDLDDPEGFLDRLRGDAAPLDLSALDDAPPPPEEGSAR